jgi:CheY-like chemotaxis protein
MTIGICVKTILYADDDLVLRKTVAAFLAKMKHAVILASDGYEALRVLADRSIDLLITDIRMPRMTGFELARQAKLMRADLKIIYVSGRFSETDRGSDAPDGVLMDKPLDPDDLIQEVNRQLSSGSDEVDA